MKDNNILRKNTLREPMGVLIHFRDDNPDVSPEAQYKTLKHYPGKVSRRNWE